MNVFIVLFLSSLTAGQLGAFGLGGGVTVYLHDFLLVPLLVVFCISALSSKKGKPWIGGTLGSSLGAFVMASVLSLLVNSQRFSLVTLGASSLYLVRFVFYASVYFIVQKFGHERLWLGGLFGVGTALAIGGLVQYVLYPDLRNLYYFGWDPHYYRLFSSLLDPNFTGIILVFTLLLGIFLWQQKKKHRVYLSLLLVIDALALILTNSRSSFLAFGASVIVLAWLYRQKMLILILLVFGLVYMLFPRNTLEITSLFRVEPTLARLQNWRQSLNLIAQQPLFGHGFNSLRALSTGQSESGIFSRAAGGVDSSVLFVLVTTGVVGALCFFWLAVSQIKLALHTKNRALGSVGVATVVAVLVHSTFNNSWFYAWVMIWIWILFGVIEGTGKK